MAKAEKMVRVTVEYLADERGMQKTISVLAPESSCGVGSEGMDIAWCEGEREWTTTEMEGELRAAARRVYGRVETMAANRTQRPVTAWGSLRPGEQEMYMDLVEATMKEIA